MYDEPPSQRATVARKRAKTNQPRVSPWLVNGCWSSCAASASGHEWPGAERGEEKRSVPDLQHTVATGQERTRGEGVVRCEAPDKGLESTAPTVALQALPGLAVSSPTYLSAFSSGEAYSPIRGCTPAHM